MEVVSLPFAVITCVLAFCFGCWLGWTICNVRWSDSQRLNVPVNWRGDRYYVFRDDDFREIDEPTDPPDVLSAE